MAQGLIARMFGALADGFGAGMGDAADKVVFESFFGRHMPERFGRNQVDGQTHGFDPSHWFAQAPHQNQTQENEHEIDR